MSMTPLTRTTTLALVATAPLLVSGAVSAQTGCTQASADIAQTIAEAWRSQTAIAAPDVVDAAQARCAQAELVELLSEDAGAPIGWKVGLTSEAAQNAFGVDHPLAGRLLADMLLEDGATVPRDFGARPIAEADLIATVASADIMAATTPLDVLAALESFSPFIELADLMVAPGAPLTADTITAINVGARLGVVGEPFTLEATEIGVQTLADMRVEIFAEGGDTMAVPGSAILGNPLNAVLWLIEDLESRGETLSPGDRISLGSFGPPMPTADLSRLEVTYTALPATPAPQVTVQFE